MPVAETVEAMRELLRRLTLARQGQRFAKVAPGLIVVATGPQLAELDRRFPLLVAVAGCRCLLQRRFVVAARGVELTQDLEGAAAPAIQLSRDNAAKPCGRLDGAAEVLDRGARRAERLGPLAGPAAELSCFLPVTGLIGVVGQLLGAAFELAAAAAELLARLADAAMQRPPLARQDLGVERLARERVAEAIAVRGLFDEELRRDQLAQRAQQRCLVEPRDGLQQLELDALADDRGEGGDVARLGTQLGAAAHHGILDAARNGKLIERSRRGAI